MCWQKGYHTSREVCCVCSMHNQGQTCSGQNQCPLRSTDTKPMPGMCYDFSGHAYILDGTTGKSIDIAPNMDFAGLACDTITPAFICKATAEGTAEYNALFSIINANTSVDW